MIIEFQSNSVKMDNFYKVTLSDFAGEQLDSTTCLISPEVSEAFDIKSGDTDYCLLSFVQPRFVKSNNILSKLLQIKVNPRVEKNCVSVLSSGGHDFCYIAPVLTSKCQVLENVEFQGKATEDRRTAVLDFIQKLVCGGTGLLPVNLGQELANENGDLVVYRYGHKLNYYCLPLLDIAVLNQRKGKLLNPLATIRLKFLLRSAAVSKRAL